MRWTIALQFDVARLPRYHRCVCEQIASGWLLRNIWPGTKLLPMRNSPELIAMHASLGARMPYREAAFLLSGLLPCQRPCSFSTVATIHFRSVRGSTSKAWTALSDQRPTAFRLPRAFDDGALGCNNGRCNRGLPTSGAQLRTRFPRKN